MIKKLTSILLILFFLIFAIKPVFAQEEHVNVYFFWGEGCPHCGDEEPFLEKLETKYPEVEVHSFEIWNSKENLEISGYGLSQSGVNIIVPGKFKSESVLFETI